MKKQCLGAMVILTLAGAVMAEPWQLTLDANLSMALNVYSDDWSGEESGTFSWVSRLEGVAQKQAGKYLQTKNTLKLAFGQTKMQEDDDSWSSPRKSTDRIDLETRWKATLGGWIDPYMAVRGISQFVDMSDTTANPYYPYVNPIDLTESVGALRELLAKDQLTWSLRLGGALRQNIDRWDPQRPDETIVTNDGGVEVVTDFEAAWRGDLLKYKTSLSFYEALFRPGSDTIPNHWRHPDLNWENTLTVSVAKYVMISYHLQVLYDKEINANARVKQMLAVGLTYGGAYPRKAPAEKEPGS